MHGLVNKAIQAFVIGAHGPDAWDAVATQAGVTPDGIEAFAQYDNALTERLLSAAMAHLNTSRDAILEDTGAFLVSGPSSEALRRLLRFGGQDFRDFLFSLDDLRDRARLAVDDLDLPVLHLHSAGPNSFVLDCGWTIPGCAALVVGVLRAMADDYGVLAMMDFSDTRPDAIEITLFDDAHSAGREFELAVVR